MHIVVGSAAHNARISVLRLWAPVSQGPGSERSHRLKYLVYFVSSDFCLNEGIVLAY